MPSFLWTRTLRFGSSFNIIRRSCSGTVVWSQRSGRTALCSCVCVQMLTGLALSGRLEVGMGLLSRALCG